MRFMNRLTRSLACLALTGLAATCWAQEATTSPATEPAATAEAPPPPVAEAPRLAPALTNVVLHTTLGDITLAIEIERAPVTAKNFLRYVDNKRFDNTTFYRSLKLTEDGKYGLVQGGLKSDPKKLFKPIAHEAPATTGLSHVDGAISMARGDPGTATADFFIVVGDLVSMDGKPDGSNLGYAVFGHVVSGMDVVHAMLEAPKSEEARTPEMKGQMLVEPVKILTVRRAP
jgi:peptidyl-prolyl cis-trans isomerase A (cyclophilin A)